MKYMFRVFLVLSILAPAAPYSARGREDAEDMFRKANSYYEQGEYGKAIDEYLKVTAGGNESFALYFNLGNAYYKAGMPGKAVLNYERAKELSSRDPDLEANYRFVTSKVRNVETVHQGVWKWASLREYRDRFSVNELLWVSSGLYLILILLLFMALNRHYRPVRFFIAAAVVLVCMTGNGLITWDKVSRINKEGVVVTPGAEALYGPFDSATVFFNVYEGMKVDIMGRKDDWCKIRRSDGKIGWVPSESVERI